MKETWIIRNANNKVTCGECAAACWCCWTRSNQHCRTEQSAATKMILLWQSAGPSPG